MNGTKELVLRLSAEQLNILKWFVDAAYAVHADFKSHTGMTMTIGHGAIIDRIPSTTPGAEPPRDAKDSGSARSHSMHLETSSSDRP